MTSAGNVALSITGPTGTFTPTGMTVTYGINSIPQCRVMMVPSDIGGPNGPLNSPDALKRKDTWTVNTSVSSNVKGNQPTTNTLKFTGLLDGISLSNTVGAIEYAMELKAVFQPLVEVHCLIPGLRTDAQNMYQAVLNPLDTSGGAFISYPSPLAPSGTDNILVYLQKFLLDVLNRQQHPETWLCNNSTVLSGSDSNTIWNSDKYNVILSQLSQNLPTWLDFSASLGGSIAANPVLNFGNINLWMYQEFISGNVSFWEAMLSILSSFNLCMVCSNSKIFVVPKHGFIKVDPTTISATAISNSPNVASPAQYSNFSYSDQGYKDLARVILVRNPTRGKTDASQPAFEYDFTIVGGYPPGPGFASDPNVPSSSAGTIVLTNHPFMFSGLNYKTSSEIVQQEQAAMASKVSNLYLAALTGAAIPLSLNSASQMVQDYTQEVTTTTPASPNNNPALSEAYGNYAEAAFYSYKYTDRVGSVTMEFNPRWVPGTCGTLYMPALNQATGDSVSAVYLQFFVTSVTHSITTSAPNQGSAITVINFSCGRIGANPIGVTIDNWTGYTAGKMTTLQNAFVSDVMGS